MVRVGERAVKDLDAIHVYADVGVVQLGLAFVPVTVNEISPLHEIDASIFGVCAEAIGTTNNAVTSTSAANTASFTLKSADTTQTSQSWRTATQPEVKQDPG